MKGECSCCRYETNVKKYPVPHHKQPAEPDALCELCAGSLASNAYQFNQQDARICGVICYVGNAILEKLGR